jgi:glycosyltransferase involved in cell wall biosynthesis
MKILLIVGHEGIYSGASYQALYLAYGLRDRGHQVVCVWGPEKGDPTLDIVTRAGFPLHTLSMRGMFNLKALARLRSLMKRERFDVVHCFKGPAMYRALWASWGLKIPAIVLNREVSVPLQYFQGSKYRSRRVDRIVVDSKAVGDIVIQTGRVKADKVRLVYDEVDLDRYYPGVDGSSARREFGVGDHDFFVGVVGNTAASRGQNYLLLAAAQIRQQIPDPSPLKYLLVGRGTDSLKPLAHDLGLDGAVSFTGFRGDLEKVVAALDVLVNTSIATESLSGAVTIAMAMGKPVIGTTLAGTPELVDDGVTGLLVPPADAEALAAAIVTMSGKSPEERAAMGARARAKMETGFSRAVRAKQMEEVYLEIIESKKQR